MFKGEKVLFIQGMLVEEIQIIKHSAERNIQRNAKGNKPLYYVKECLWVGWAREEATNYLHIY